MYVCMMFFFLFCFFKQKTAYEMRISDWSSDVCSSDLQKAGHCPAFLFRRGSARWQRGALAPEQADDEQDHDRSDQGADEACRFAGLVEAGCLPDPSRQQRAGDAQQRCPDEAHAVLAGFEQARQPSDAEDDQDDVETVAGAEQTFHSLPISGGGWSRSLIGMAPAIS